MFHMLLFHTLFETAMYVYKIGGTYKAIFSVDRHDVYDLDYEMTFAL